MLLEMLVLIATSFICQLKVWQKCKDANEVNPRGERIKFMWFPVIIGYDFRVFFCSF